MTPPDSARDETAENRRKVYSEAKDGSRVAVMLDTASDRVRRICTSHRVQRAYIPKTPSEGHLLSVRASQIDMFVTLGGDGTPILMLDLITEITKPVAGIVPLVFITDARIDILPLHEDGRLELESVGHMDWPGPSCNCPTCVGNRRENRTETLNDIFARWGEARHGVGGKNRLD